MRVLGGLLVRRLWGFVGSDYIGLFVCTLWGCFCVPTYLGVFLSLFLFFFVPVMPTASSSLPGVLSGL